ncbi:uncharacterized protein LOC111461824 [Cucurbita moschata]|uniref:Uncharacterized protein LOC111461824 n=1 Tax=Cucurbita moschata TaxID=3662 RepID=A0A6J1H9S2_CUCMO|nr:uncharacterized protein LOC111461824 [Cucurbita moschata]
MVDFSSPLLFSVFLFSFLHPISSFNLRSLPKQPNFDPHIALIGDAVLVDGDGHGDFGDSFVKLTRPVASSFGLLLHNKPLKLHGSTSFYTQFTFAVSPDNGDGIVLSLFPGGGFPDEISPEKWLHRIGFVSGNGSNLSGGILKMEKGIVVPNNGGKLTSWVDYDSSSKTVEIRLSKFGESRPYDPLLAYPIDLSSKCEGREVFVGLSSGNSKSSEWSRVFSWRFGLRNVPKWMHSMPVDPRRPSLKQDEEGSQKNHLRPLTIVAGLIFATGCGALMAFLVLFVWAIAGNRNAISVAEPQSVDFQYEKVSLVAEEGSKDDGVRG